MSSPSSQIRTYLLPSNQDNQPPSYPDNTVANPTTPPLTPRIAPPEIRMWWVHVLWVASSIPQMDTPMNTMGGMDSMPMFDPLGGMKCSPSFSTDFNIQDLFL